MQIIILDAIPSKSTAYKAALGWELKELFPSATIEIHTPIVPGNHKIRHIIVAGDKRSAAITDVLDDVCEAVRDWTLGRIDPKPNVVPFPVAVDEDQPEAVD